MFVRANHTQKNSLLNFCSKALVCVLSISLIFGPSTLYAQSLFVSPISGINLPPVGTLMTKSPAFNPPIIRGLSIHPQNPLEFDFIVDRGDDDLEGEPLENEALKMIKYFLASLTVPKDEMWVNLSPYEKDRIIPDDFGVTEMGRDLLAQDYLLKQLTASLMYPEDELGQKFWDRVYKKSYEEFGTTEIPINTFNKIWIVPDKAVVYEHENNVFVINQHLKVMLEEDYLALQQHSALENKQMSSDVPMESGITSGVQSQIIREILIPEIEKEVNEGKIFSNLRQIYNSMILAIWYKQNLKESLLGQVYVDQNKVKGVDVEDRDVKQKIYDQYLEAFKEGVYNYIKEDIDPSTQEIIPRKYFSGGMIAPEIETKTNSSPLTEIEQNNLDDYQSSFGLNTFNVKLSSILPKTESASPIAGKSSSSLKPSDYLPKDIFRNKNFFQRGFAWMFNLTIEQFVPNDEVKQIEISIQIGRIINLLRDIEGIYEYEIGGSLQKKTLLKDFSYRGKKQVDDILFKLEVGKTADLEILEHTLSRLEEKLQKTKEDVETLFQDFDPGVSRLAIQINFMNLLQSVNVEYRTRMKFDMTPVKRINMQTKTPSLNFTFYEPTSFSSSNKNVLIIESNNDERRILAEYLNEKYSTVEKDPLDALIQIKNMGTAPAVVVTDNFDVVKSLWEKYPKVPVIFRVAEALDGLENEYAPVLSKYPNIRKTLIKDNRVGVVAKAVKKLYLMSSSPIAGRIEHEVGSLLDEMQNEGVSFEDIEKYFSIFLESNDIRGLRNLDEYSSFKGKYPMSSRALENLFSSINAVAEIDSKHESSFFYEALAKDGISYVNEEDYFSVLLNKNRVDQLDKHQHYSDFRKRYPQNSLNVEILSELFRSIKYIATLELKDQSDSFYEALRKDGFYFGNDKDNFLIFLDSEKSDQAKTLENYSLFRENHPQYPVEDEFITELFVSIKYLEKLRSNVEEIFYLDERTTLIEFVSDYLSKPVDLEELVRQSVRNLNDGNSTGIKSLAKGLKKATRSGQDFKGIINDPQLIKELFLGFFYGGKDTTVKLDLLRQKEFMILGHVVLSERLISSKALIEFLRENSDSDLFENQYQELLAFFETRKVKQSWKDQSNGEEGMFELRAFTSPLKRHLKQLWVEKNEEIVEHDDSTSSLASQLISGGVESSVDVPVPEISPNNDETGLPALLPAPASSPLQLENVKNLVEKREVGGIDFNPDLLDLQIKRDGNGVPLPLFEQPLLNMQIEGFLPIIINVTPTVNLPFLLGFSDTEEETNDTTNNFDLSWADQKKWIPFKEKEEIVVLN